MRSNSLHSDKGKKKIPKELLDSYKNTAYLPPARPEARYPMPQHRPPMPYVVVTAPPQEANPHQAHPYPSLHSRTIIDDILEDDIEKIAYQDCLEVAEKQQPINFTKSIVTEEAPIFLDPNMVERSASLPTKNATWEQRNKQTQQQPSPKKKQEQRAVHQQENRPQVVMTKKQHPAHYHVRKPAPEERYMVERRDLRRGDPYYRGHPQEYPRQTPHYPREQIFVDDRQIIEYERQNYRKPRLAPEYEHPDQRYCQKHRGSRDHYEEELYYPDPYLKKQSPHPAYGYPEPYYHPQDLRSYDSAHKMYAPQDKGLRDLSNYYGKGLSRAPIHDPYMSKSYLPRHSSFYDSYGSLGYGATSSGHFHKRAPLAEPYRERAPLNHYRTYY